MLKNIKVKINRVTGKVGYEYVITGTMDGKEFTISFHDFQNSNRILFISELAEVIRKISI